MLNKAFGLKKIFYKVKCLFFDLSFIIFKNLSCYKYINFIKQEYFCEKKSLELYKLFKQKQEVMSDEDAFHLHIEELLVNHPKETLKVGCNIEVIFCLLEIDDVVLYRFSHFNEAQLVFLSGEVNEDIKPIFSKQQVKSIKNHFEMSLDLAQCVDLDVVLSFYKTSFNQKKIMCCPIFFSGNLEGILIVSESNLEKQSHKLYELNKALGYCFFQYHIQEKPSFFSKGLSSIPFGVILCSQDLTIFYMNDEAHKLLNLCYMPESYYELQELFLDLKSFEFYKNKGAFQIKNQLLFIKTELNKLDGTHQVFLFKEDYFKSKTNQEKELSRLKLISDMASKIAHEIKNPLVSVKTFTQLLERRWMDAEFKMQFQNCVLPQVERMNMMCKTLLKLGRSVSPLKKEVVFLNLFKKLKEKYHTFSKIEWFSLDEVLKMKVVINEYDIFDALTYILDNALNSEVKAEKVEFRVLLIESRLSVVIIDDGVGIAKENKELIFEPFFSTWAGYTGLGLTLTKKILQDHHVGFDISRKNEKTVVSLLF